jgi:organic hydroperoxide reductase OsmC/OhrA
LIQLTKMLIEARVENQHQQHTVSLTTNGSTHSLQVPTRPSGFGSSANGGELLCLALATCYCNDIYREAEKLGITVIRVEVEAQAEFGAAGEPASSLRSRASVFARAPEAEIRELMLHTDRVAEVHNALRRGMEVQFEVGGARSEA